MVDLSGTSRQVPNPVFSGTEQVAFPVTRVKSATDVFGGDTSTVTDNHLQFSLASATTYSFDGYITIKENNSSGALTLTFLSPTGATLDANAWTDSVAGSHLTETSSEVISRGDTFLSGTHLRGVVVTTTDTGAFAPRWKTAGVSGGSFTQVFVNSWMTLRQISDVP